MVKAKETEEKGERVIALIGGDSGSGKSFFVANLKEAVIYDTDVGGGLSYADARIAKNGSERVEMFSYSAILEDIRERARSGRLKKHVCIDHITGLQQDAQLRHNPALEADYGRANAKATGEWRKIREAIRSLDCNLFVTAHLKAEYQNDKQIGVQADGAKNVEADMSVVIYLTHPKGSSYPSLAKVVKWRRDPEDPRGAVPRTFPFTMAEFEKIGGNGMTRERDNVQLATPDRVTELERLLSILKLPDGTTEKWLSKAGAEKWADLTAEQLESAINHCKKLVEGNPKAKEVK